MRLATPSQTAWPYAKPQNVHFIVTAVASYAPEALADGTIVVPLGLLRRADTDDEVIFLLGHEYGHLALGHFAKNEQLRNQRRMLRIIADLYQASVEVSEIRAQKVGDQINFTIDDEARIRAASDRAALARQRLQWLLDYGTTPLWGRRQEDEADAVGFDLAVATQRNAELGSDKAFNRFIVDAADQASLANQLQTQLQDALQVSLATTGQQAMDTGDFSKFSQAMTQSLQTGLRDRALRSMEKHLSAKHRPPAARSAGLSKYAELAYPDRTPPLKFDKTWLTEVRKTKEYQDADKALTALLAAQEARAKGDNNEAAAKISVALGTPFGGQPVFANEAGAIFTDLGDTKQADVWYSRADANLNQSLDGFHSHIDMLVAAKLYPKALQVIELAKGRIGSDRDFLPSLVRISFKTRKNDIGIKYLERCMTDADTELQQNCMMAAVRPEDAEWAKLPESSRLRIEMASRTASTKTKTSGLGDLLSSLDLSQDKDKD
jgi:predicted Zn-dependent protease